MAYLVKADSTPKLVDPLQTNAIDFALSNFLGGFSTLKSEISQLKDSVLSTTSHKSTGSIKFIS